MYIMNMSVVRAFGGVIFLFIEVKFMEHKTSHFKGTIR